MQSFEHVAIIAKPDGNIAYNESIVKKLPDPPKRKDRI